MGYGVNQSNQPDNRFSQNLNPKIQYNNPPPGYEQLVNRSETYQFQTNPDNPNPYIQSNQYDQTNRNFLPQNNPNVYNQPNSTQNTPNYQPDSTSKPVIANLFQNMGINQLNT